MLHHHSLRPLPEVMKTTNVLARTPLSVDHYYNCNPTFDAGIEFDCTCVPIWPLLALLKLTAFGSCLFRFFPRQRGIWLQPGGHFPKPHEAASVASHKPPRHAADPTHAAS